MLILNNIKIKKTIGYSILLVIYACNTKKDVIPSPEISTITVTVSAPSYHFIKNEGDFADPGTDIQYTASIMNNAKAYVWHFNDGSSKDSSSNPFTTHTYKKSGNYTTMLTIYTQSGNCITSAPIYVNIKVYDGMVVNSVAAISGNIPINTTDFGRLDIYNISKQEEIFDYSKVPDVANNGLGVWLYNVSTNYPFPVLFANDTLGVNAYYHKTGSSFHTFLQRISSSNQIWQGLNQSDRDKLLNSTNEVTSELRNEDDIIRLYCKLHSVN